MPLTVGLPSGVGDCMWAVNKLAAVGPLHYLVADGWPYRTKPWFELLGPEVTASVEYGGLTYPDIVVFEEANGIGMTPRWERLSAQQWGTLWLEPNRHLEMGHPLQDWLPDLPTNYHLPMFPSVEEEQRAAKLVADLPRPLTGISAASYRGSEAWKTWGYPEWSRFLKRYQAEVGGTPLLLGGFWDDLTSRLAEEDGWPDLVGRTSLGCAVSVLRHCERFIGFSSGLGMLHASEWGRTFLLWPDHQVALSRSWVDPWMLECGTYAVSQWRDPDEVYPLVKRWLKASDHPERRRVQL